MNIRSSSTNSSVEVSLVIPTYNERENIGFLIKHVYAILRERRYSFEVIVVDDDSPDGTWEVVQEMMSEYPYLRVLRRLGERGLARAVMRGWQEAQGEILAVMDGDLQHPPEHLQKLVSALRNDSGEIAIASRYVEQGSVSEWKWHRRIVSSTATVMASILLPGRIRRVKDPMSGFFILKKSVIEGVTLKPIGYKILLEVLARGRYQRVVEVPYTFEERTEGGSKMGPKQVWQYVIHLLRIRLGL